MNELTRFERNIDRMVSNAVSGDPIWLEQRDQLLAKIAKLIGAEENRNAQITKPMSIGDLKIVAQNTAHARKIKLTLSPREGEMRIKFHKDTEHDVIDLIMRAANKFKEVDADELLGVSFRGDVYITPINTVRFKARNERHTDKIEFEYMDERNDA